jgi:hypothetical protein
VLTDPAQTPNSGASDLRIAGENQSPQRANRVVLCNGFGNDLGLIATAIIAALRLALFVVK